MKRLIFFSLVLALLIVSARITLAQQPTSISSLEDEIKVLEALERSEASTAEVRQLNRQFLTERKSRLRTLLEIRIAALRKYRSAAGNVLKSDENQAITKSIQSLEQKLTALEGEISTAEPSGGSPDATPANVASVMVTSSLPVVGIASNAYEEIEGSQGAARGQSLGAQGATPVVLGLSSPGKRRTALPTGKFELSWALRSGRTVFHPPKGTKYLVEVSEQNTFNAATDTIHEEVTDDTSFEIPKDSLRPGKKYFWQVTAICPPSLTCPNGMLTAVNGPFEFTTALDPFRRLESKGFTLQRSVAGDDATEGATFSFLRNFRGKNVYATDFALIWDRPTPVNLGNARTQLFPELSVEGHLSSDRAASEDLWRFGASAKIFTSFTSVTKDNNGNIRFGRLKGLSSYLGGKFEADRDFETKKVYFEALETPTAVSLYMGKYSGNTDSDIQFRWRPYFSFQAGRTMKRGAAALPEDTVLRLIPRLRTDLKLNFISRPLGFKRTLLYADNTFYYLPLENAAKTPNFLVSGFEILFNSDIGLAFTYKNGKSAPKFEPVHSLGAGLTISFGNKSDN
ncbi:MAG TPA: hypothetical protein VKB86_15155 [Pyrinomonadaceae bacterium]|nr:hypothetical protein [Pyrinomonadaceae bacterium]